MLGDKQAFKMAASIQFSDYYVGLDGPTKSRYKLKIAVCGFDLYALKKSEFSENRPFSERSISRCSELLGVANLVGHENPNEGLQVNGSI